MEDTTINKFNYKELKAKLIEFNIKATQQRIVIYEALINSKNHPAAESIYEAIKLNNPSISLATVYKTLDTFVSVGLAVKVMTQEGFMRYDAKMDSHNHIYCVNTNEILDYEDQELNLLIEDYFKKKNIQNLKIKDIRLHINGEKLDLNKDITIK